MLQITLSVLFSNFSAPYCKQLYLDVTNSNNGKITWKILKPIIQGKILYGPVNDDTKEIVSFGNKTFEEMNRLREFVKALETSVKMLSTNKEFRANFDNLLNLAKSPFIQAILGGSIDIQTIETVLDSIVNDTRIVDVIETIGNIFECFSVDRFIPVKDEKELEDMAYDLSKKKLFYAAAFFTTKENETSYKLRMEVDNTPVTIENKNRFWFPGAEASFELEMRYHRGFIQIQNSIDTAIIKHKKKKQFEATHKGESSDDLDFSDFQLDGDATDEPDKSSEEFTDQDDFDGLKLDENGEINEEHKTMTTTTEADIYKTLQGKLNISAADVNKFSDGGNLWDFEDDATTTSLPSDDTTNAPILSRNKRQLDSLLGMFGFSTPSEKLRKEVKYEVDDITFFTKQFPYPKYTRDDFKKGL